MTARLFFDPFAIMLKIFNDKYPEKSAVIQFVSGMHEESEAYGETLFPDDGGIPVISIDAMVPFSGTIDVLGHELAHVATKGNGHGKKWERAYDFLNDEWERQVEKIENVKSSEHLKIAVEAGL